MEVAIWSTSDLITNLTFFDEPEDERRLADTGTDPKASNEPQTILCSLLCVP